MLGSIANFAKHVVTATIVFVAGSAAATAAAPGADVDDLIIPVFDEAAIEWDPALVDGTERDGVRLYQSGQALEKTVELPPLPANQREARRIVATIIVEPAIVEEGDKAKPGDPWTRLGSLSVMRSVDPREAMVEPQEVELMRFVTGFGGPGTFTQDLTSLAPMLHGKTTLRLQISTYKKPAWNVTFTLTYAATSAGYRRPVWAQPIFVDPVVNSARGKLTATIDVPKGLARPRLHITSSGHATDGTGGDEFISRTHVLRIDGVEVARWRPWSENGGPDHHASNPSSGRITLDGRELWSSDLDRSGWRPGCIVEPLRIPVPELTHGRHTIQLEVLNIRAPDQQNNHGYWRVTCIAVADEPWPDESKPAP